MVLGTMSSSRKTIAVCLIVLLASMMLVSCSIHSDGVGQDAGADASAEVLQSEEAAVEESESVSQQTTKPEDVVLNGASKGEELESTDDDAEGDEPEAVDDTASRYAAYYSKCQEYSTLYGAPGVTGVDGSFGEGLALVWLVDMDGDGADELVLGYISPIDVTSTRFDDGVEIWSYRDGELVCDYRDCFALYGTDGYTPYVELYERNDGAGYYLAKDNCFGSGPPVFTHELWGYADDGSFEQVAGKAEFWRIDGSGADYYSCPPGTTGDWQPENWESITEDEYNVVFESVCTGEHAVRFLFSLPEQYRTDAGMMSVEEVIASTRETISFLADQARG